MRQTVVLFSHFFAKSYYISVIFDSHIEFFYFYYNKNCGKSKCIPNKLNSWIIKFFHSFIITVSRQEYYPLRNETYIRSDHFGSLPGFNQGHVMRPLLALATIKLDLYQVTRSFCKQYENIAVVKRYTLVTLATFNFPSYWWKLLSLPNSILS